MTIEQFFSKYLGKFIDFDNFYGAQCFDLAQQYNKEVYNGPFLTGQAASDLWETYPVEIYDRVLNTIDAIPKLGDMIIWKKSTALPYGHVAIVKSANQTSFTSMDQNWPTGGKCQYIEHNYESPMVMGWLRPKKQNTSTELEACLKAHSEAVDSANKKDGEIRQLGIDKNTLERKFELLQIEMTNRLAQKDLDCEGKIKAQETSMSKTFELKEQEYKKAIGDLEEKVKEKQIIVEKPPVKPQGFKEKVLAIMDLIFS